MKDRNELRTRDTVKAKTRERIQKDTEEFLKNGGIIKIIPRGVTTGNSKLHPFMQATISEVECFNIKSNKPIINNEEE